MGAIQLTSPVSNPEHVCPEIVVLLAHGFGMRLLISKQQAFMGGEQLHALPRVRIPHTRSPHEIKGVVNSGNQILVLTSRLGFLNKGQIPVLRMLQIGDPTIVWNFPVDATFETTEPFGWPQLSLQLFGPDFMGRDVVRGYGAVHVPTQAGHHEMYVKIFAPQSSSAFQSIQSTLMGTPPEFNNPKFATTGEARSVTRVQSTGTVKVCMDVVLVNMKALDLVS